MFRRELLALASASALARPALAQPGQSRILRFVPQANLTSLDPVWTTANITRHHGFMVYDTLYGLDGSLAARPQMAEGHVLEDGGTRCVITLRDGLRFHDGEPVRATDAVTSLRRWMRRNAAGQHLAGNTDALEALDDRRIQFRLRKPQPRMFEALASVTSPVAFIMPERIARTDPFTQIRDAIGSGPFRFRPDEYNSGSRAVYERNPDYRPTSDSGKGLTAGPKVAHFDRVEWLIIPDAATAAAALQAGEIDWFESPPPEVAELLRRSRTLSVEHMDTMPMPGVLRFNHLHPPFNNRKLRQAVLHAVDQRDFMSAVVGDTPADYDAACGFFTPNSPLANRTGMEPLLGPRNLDRVREMMKEAGYNGEPARLIGPTDIVAPAAITQVAADLFGRLGFNMDVVLTDWGSVVQRRASREPLEKGGWSLFPTSVNATDFLDPSVHFALRGNGTDAWLGWPTSPRIEELREAWFDAPDLPAQQEIARRIQAVAFEEVPYLPVGAYMQTTALKRDLRDRVRGFSIFWNLKRV